MPFCWVHQTAGNIFPDQLQDLDIFQLNQRLLMFSEIARSHDNPEKLRRLGKKLEKEKA